MRCTICSSSPSASSNDSGTGPDIGAAGDADAASAPGASAAGPPTSPPAAGPPSWRLEDLTIDRDPEPARAGQSVDFTCVWAGLPASAVFGDPAYAGTCLARQSGYPSPSQSAPALVLAVPGHSRGRAWFRPSTGMEGQDVGSGSTRVSRTRTHATPRLRLLRRSAVPARDRHALPAGSRLRRPRADDPRDRRLLRVARRARG